MRFINAYEDKLRAESYSRLEFPGTYYLAYRDLPEIILNNIKTGSALDFGCGTGRSTRFLKSLGFNTTGIDISAGMIAEAKKADPAGDYQVIPDGDFSMLKPGSYDLILSVFTFDNIPGAERRISLFRSLRDLLKDDGRMIILDATPELYVNDWASFITSVFPENKTARSGEIVKDIMIDVNDRRPVEDILWTDEDYKDQFNKAGLKLLAAYRPLGKKEEPFGWINEIVIAPWVIYVLMKD